MTTVTSFDNMTPEMIRLITMAEQATHIPESRTSERIKAGKILDLPIGIVHRATNIKQIFSDFGENFILTIDNKQYFTNKRLCRSISLYAQAKKQMPTIVTFIVSSIEIFTADNRDISYANVESIGVF